MTQRINSNRTITIDLTHFDLFDVKLVPEPNVDVLLIRPLRTTCNEALTSLNVYFTQQQFLAWLLFGWQQSCMSIGGHFIKWESISGDFNTEID